MSKHVAIVAIVCAHAGTAVAQDFDDTTTETETTDTDTTTDAAPATTTTDTTAAAGTAAGGPTFGIEVELNTTGTIGILHGLYNIGGNYLDIGIGFDFVNTSPDEGDSTTETDIRLIVGYRMYRALSGRIRPFLEPYASIASIDTIAGDPLTLGLGARFGVDFELVPQFTLGAALGAELDYITADGGDQFRFGFYTTSINATFWW